MSPRALFIGNSDGIGRGVTRRFLERGYEVTGISRSPLDVEDEGYVHHRCDVREARYGALLDEILEEGPVDLAAWFVGIGDPLDLDDLPMDVRIMETNLGALVRTTAKVIPAMLARGEGHFIGLSSIADCLVSAEAPAYCASKAGVTSYLEGLGRAVAPRGVAVTNLRFGFVDTKMAKGRVKPFMMSVERAVAHFEHCCRRRPLRYSAPKIMVPLVWLRASLGAFLGR